jgi:hypothetical protein
MFASHQSAIATFVAVGTPDWTKRAAAVVFGACSTIKQPTFQVQGELDKVVALGTAAKNLNFAARKLCYFGILRGEHIAPLERAAAAMALPVPAVDLAHVYLTDLPGIGLAKAGFILQMIWGLGGCIDSENQKLYSAKLGFDVVAGTIDKGASHETKLATVRQYQALVDVCSGGGATGSATMWDAWCAYIAAKKVAQITTAKKSSWTGPLPTADDVSALHTAWIATAYNALWRTGPVTV